MRLVMDHCMSDFTNRMQEMFSNFETRLVSTISSRPSENSSRDVISSPKITRGMADISNNSNLVDNDRSNGKYELSCKIKLKIYDGNDDLEEYLTQFNLLAELHNWSSKTKALLLVSKVRLRLREVGPKSINGAENIAVRLEALRVADRQKGRNVRTAETETVQDHGLKRKINEINQGIESLTSEIVNIKNQMVSNSEENIITEEIRIVPIEI
ncbi:unnamed protein product [Mytilus coruscus]|uniref:Uncharacterized protein n=1 Tax=Mytilus coruscus TaxID=42192 RepID=A0A6J8CKD4_MYTCO|nr:unnamed protein product [Mytilus coruscus]